MQKLKESVKVVFQRLTPRVDDVVDTLVDYSLFSWDDRLYLIN